MLARAEVTCAPLSSLRRIVVQFFEVGPDEYAGVNGIFSSASRCQLNGYSMSWFAEPSDGEL
jgi:hypothetical protein